ncbi:hypothetical protein BKA62DRAFT_789921 [Auriculariales sp. MPI-PUGE-AT-0066]|nr:hypothetical protein BKA62DRAFT_789921 [Auriculariales sp. MPI-PUGE-AT-0066]
MSTLIILDLDAISVAQRSNTELATVLQELQPANLKVVCCNPYCTPVLRQLGDATSLRTVHIYRSPLQQADVSSLSKEYGSVYDTIGISANPIQMPQIRVLSVPLFCCSTKSFPGVKFLRIIAEPDEFSLFSAASSFGTVFSELEGLGVKGMPVHCLCLLLQHVFGHRASRLEYIEVMNCIVSATAGLEMLLPWLQRVKVMSWSTQDNHNHNILFKSISQACLSGFGRCLEELYFSYDGAVVQTFSEYGSPMVPTVRRTVILLFGLFAKCGLPAIKTFSLQTDIMGSEASDAPNVVSDLNSLFRGIRTHHSRLETIKWQNLIQGTHASAYANHHGIATFSVAQKLCGTKSLAFEENGAASKRGGLVEYVRDSRPCPIHSDPRRHEYSEYIDGSRFNAGTVNGRQQQHLAVPAAAWSKRGSIAPRRFTE